MIISKSVCLLTDIFGLIVLFIPLNEVLLRWFHASTNRHSMCQLVN